MGNHETDGLPETRSGPPDCSAVAFLRLAPFRFHALSWPQRPGPSDGGTLWRRGSLRDLFITSNHSLCSAKPALTQSPWGREFAACFGATARVITCQRPNCRIGIAPLLDPACPLPLPGIHRAHAGRESLSRRQSRDERTTENYNRTRDNYLPARQVADGRPAGARQKLPGSRLGWST